MVGMSYWYAWSYSPPLYLSIISNSFPILPGHVHVIFTCMTTSLLLHRSLLYPVASKYPRRAWPCMALSYMLTTQDTLPMLKPTHDGRFMQSSYSVGLTLSALHGCHARFSQCGSPALPFGYLKSTQIVILVQTHPPTHSSSHVHIRHARPPWCTNQSLSYFSRGNTKSTRLMHVSLLLIHQFCSL